MVSWHDYPRGKSGIALFLLRSSLATLILIEANHQHLFLQSPIVICPVGVLGVALCLGILTSWCSVVGAASGVFLVLTNHMSASGIGVVTFFICIVVSILGPGVYSMDSALFGRRRVVL